MTNWKDNPLLNLEVSVRPIRRFCNEDCQGRYMSWILEMVKIATKETIPICNATISNWETYRLKHGRCYFCSSKLTSARKKTI